MVHEKLRVLLLCNVLFMGFVVSMDGKKWRHLKGCFLTFQFVLYSIGFMASLSCSSHCHFKGIRILDMQRDVVALAK